QRDVVAHVAERDPHRETDPHRVRRAADDVGRETEVGLLDELHEADDVRDVHARDPALVIHGEARDGPMAADGLPGDVPAETARTDRARWVDVPAAVATAEDLEPARTARAPEMLGLGFERGEWQPDLAHPRVATRAV